MGWWLVPPGVSGWGCASFSHGGVGNSKRGFCFGQADLAVPAVQNTRAPAPLPAAVSSRPCADSTAHQLAAIYLFFTPPPHPLPSLCLSQKQQQRTGSSSAASLLQAPAKKRWPEMCAAQETLPAPPRNTPRSLPGERDRLRSVPLRCKMLSQPLEHLAAASLSALRAKPPPSREMG